MRIFNSDIVKLCKTNPDLDNSILTAVLQHKANFMTCKSHFRAAVNETHDRAVSSMQYTERKTVQLHFLSYEQQITCLPHTAHVSASRTKIVSLIIVSILPCIHVHHTSLAHTETQLDIMLVYSEVSMINSQVCLFSGL